MAPTAGIVLKCGGDVHAVAANKEALRTYVRACREAGDVLQKAGYTKRHAPIFNLYYWLPDWLALKVFRNFFRSRFVEIAMGLHAPVVGDEVLAMAEEGDSLRSIWVTVRR